MSQLTVAAVSMTTREIAELTGKEHRNVLADVRGMLESLKIDLLSFQQVYKAGNGQSQTEYKLPKDLVLTLVSGYNVQMRKRIIDRWIELESGPAVDPIELLNDPAVVRGLLLTYSEKVIALEGAVSELKPKAVALDRIATCSHGSYCIRDAAKVLQIREKILKQCLIAMRWVYQRPMTAGLIAYADTLQMGIMEHKIANGEKSDGSEWTSIQARITAKGLAWLSERMPWTMHDNDTGTAH